MDKKAYYITAAEMAERGGLPPELVSGENLVYSSPATLSYNSPGAQGFGVKRAGLVIPESVMLVVAPACCGRNTTVLADEGGYADRMFFLQMDETDLVTGRHLTDIPQAVKEICEVCAVRPKVVVICITCVDALLGTDLERVCRKAEAFAGVHVVPSYMYALTREGKNPPMVAIREAICSLLEKRPTDPHTVNLLGYFMPLEDDCEIYELLAQIGLTEIHEVSRKTTLDAYREMGSAQFNLILHPESRKAAFAMEKRLGIPYAELTRLYELDRIRRQYRLFGAALGVTFDDERYYREAEQAVMRLTEVCEGKTFAVGQVVNGNAIEMALALEKLGLKVNAVFANVGEEDMPFVRELAALTPELRIYQPLSPSMMQYGGEVEADVSIGVDAALYCPNSCNVKWNEEVQPFGYRGLVHFCEAVERSVQQ